MRISWRCDNCHRKHYHPTKAAMRDERRPLRAHQRMFDTQYCVEAWERVTEKMVRGVVHA